MSALRGALRRYSRPAPHHGEPGLLGWWFAGGTEKVLDRREAGGLEQPRPALAGQVGAVALALPAFVLGGHRARVGTEQRAFGSERSVELAEHPRQRGARHME